MNRFKMTAITLGLLSGYFMPSLRADDMNKETRLTIDGPLQVQDTVLAPGKYVFMLTDPNNDRTVVSIYDADRTHLEGIVIGVPAYRMDAGAKQMFTISQLQGDQQAKLRTWFFPGDNYGVEFVVKATVGKVHQVSKSNQKDHNAGVNSDVSTTD
ncbi:MAG TPA: hypothetical protein VI756_14565 [Blastocatellia bacterium]